MEVLSFLLEILSIGVFDAPEVLKLASYKVTIDNVDIPSSSGSR